MCVYVYVYVYVYVCVCVCVCVCACACVACVMAADSMVVCGGGASEMAMADAVSDLARRTSTKESGAIEAFSHALSSLPTILADNAGLDSADLVAQMRSSHADGHHNVGLNISRGTTGDMVELGVTDSYKLKRQIILSAAEAAEMILRVDRIVRAAPRQRVPDQYPC